tara:strand:- start:2274 stop:3002 length:729 start_codon:yes stop_codon:yes gene_type:complete
MKAFILAAGVSRRLYPHTYNIPKCLLNVGGKPIIHYQLDALKSIGIVDIVMIVGYHRELLINHLKEAYPEINFEFIINHHYFETNTAYSIYVGRKKLNTDYLLMNADVIYPKKMLQIIAGSEYKTALAVDIKLCGREEVKVIDGGNNTIVAIGKELIENQCLGEFVGVAKLSNEFTLRFSKSLKDLVTSGGKNDYFEAAIQPLLKELSVNYVNVSKYNCVEIDFIEDLELARNIYSPENESA